VIGGRLAVDCKFFLVLLSAYALVTDQPNSAEHRSLQARAANFEREVNILKTGREIDVLVLTSE